MNISEMNFGALSSARRTKKQRPTPGAWVLVCGAAGHQGGAAVAVACVIMKEDRVRWLTTTAEEFITDRFPYWRPITVSDLDALRMVTAYESEHGAPEKILPNGYQEGERTGV